LSASKDARITLILGQPQKYVAMILKQSFKKNKQKKRQGLTCRKYLSGITCII
jgi:hypothetical protein